MIEIRLSKVNALTVRCPPASTSDLLDQLSKRLGQKPCLYTGEAAILDLTPWNQADQDKHKLSIEQLQPALQAAGVHLIAICSSLADFENQAEALGLKSEKNAPKSAESSTTTEATPSTEAANPEIPTASVTVEAHQPTAEPRKTLVIEQAVRSGQKIYAQDADLIVIGQVSPGAEVIADGNIHVYGTLRGRALAGASGDRKTKILSTCMEAELVAIAGYYLTFEAGFPEENRAKPTLVYLDETREPAQLALRPINIR